MPDHSRSHYHNLRGNSLHTPPVKAPRLAAAHQTQLTTPRFATAARLATLLRTWQTLAPSTATAPKWTASAALAARVKRPPFAPPSSISSTPMSNRIGLHRCRVGNP